MVVCAVTREPVSAATPCYSLLFAFFQGQGSLPFAVGGRTLYVSNFCGKAFGLIKIPSHVPCQPACAENLNSDGNGDEGPKRICTPWVAGSPGFHDYLIDELRDA